MGDKYNRRVIKTPEELAIVDDYLESLREHIGLSQKDTAAILSDFEQLILFYLISGMSAQQAIARIGSNPLGDFYQPSDKEWYPLDRAAKVYPLSLTQSKMAVYRVSVYLKSKVIPCVLQVALLSTIKRFPTFSTTVRKGFFWHYLDATRRHFQIREETAMPCMPIDISRSEAFSFQIQYYKTRISLEAFHILTDGTGAITFLKTLTREYFRLLGKDVPYDADILNLSDHPDPKELRDDFQMADKTARASGLLSRPAAQISGKSEGSQPTSVLHFQMSASQLRRISKQYKTTVTGFIVSALFLASAVTLKKDNPEQRIQIQVPVNMRNYYPSKTLLNFSMFAVLKLRYRQISTLEETILLVEKQLRKETSKSAMDQMITRTNNLIFNPLLRFMPLILKHLIFRSAVNPFKDRTQTTTFSNLGVVQNDFDGLVESFEATMGPNVVNKVVSAMISYEDNAVLTLTKSTSNREFEEELYQLLVAAGIRPEIEEVHR